LIAIAQVAREGSEVRLIEERLAERQPHFTNAERRVAGWLEGNIERVAFLTVNAVAAATGVSEATIVRFARKMDYESYSEMQRAAQEGLQRQFSLVDKLQRTLGADQGEGPLRRAYLADMANLQRTYERLDERHFESAVRTLAHAHRVSVIGLRASAGSAVYLAFALQLVRPRVSLLRLDLDDVHEQLLDSDPGDAMLVVSVAKPARRAVEVVREALERRGMSIVAITTSRLSTIGSLAHTPLLVAAEGTFNSYAAVASISGALVDGVAAALRDSATARLRSLDEINVADEVYIT
jgi:DNA-binding MurR/RpiR family transcriptional regulator